MSKSIELVKELGTKLNEDLSNVTPRSEGDLYYVMDIRLQDAVRGALASSGVTDYDTIMTKSIEASKEFLTGIIELSKSYE